jgi:hypothetical protein
MGWSCSIHGKDRCAHDIMSQGLKGRDHLGHLGIDVTVTLK